MTKADTAEAATAGVRVDKWLWAARFFKTRSIAAAAVAGGKVKVNGERAKAAKMVRPGDALRIHVGPFEHVVHVRALSTRRGSTAVAALLYEESEESKARRRELATQLAAERVYAPHAKGRPSKRARRALIRFKHGDDR